MKLKRGQIGFILFALLLVIIFIMLSLFGNKGMESSDINIASNTVDIDEHNNEKRKSEEAYIEIPVFSDMYIYEDAPEVYLNNPVFNKVYFQFKVSDSEGNVLFDEDVKVEPGKALPVDLYSVLGKGEHELNIDISTFDIETGEQCNGAHQTAKIIAD